MSSLVTNPTPMFTDPMLSEKLQNAKIYIGIVGGDVLNLDNK